jgi:hypothetical protein
MKFLDIELFQNQIIKSFKSQTNIINNYSNEIKSIVGEIEKFEQIDIKNDIKKK